VGIYSALPRPAASAPRLLTACRAYAILLHRTVFALPPPRTRFYTLRSFLHLPYLHSPAPRVRCCAPFAHGLPERHRLACQAFRRTCLAPVPPFGSPGLPAASGTNTDGGRCRSASDARPEPAPTYLPLNWWTRCWFFNIGLAAALWTCRVRAPTGAFAPLLHHLPRLAGGDATRVRGFAATAFAM